MEQTIVPVLESGERILHSRLSRESNESLAISDLREWRELVSEGDEHHIIVPYDQIEEFMKDAKGQEIFVYHTHPYRDPYKLNPPTPRDLAVQGEFKKIARRNNKFILSRVVEKFGVWEYDMDYFMAPDDPMRFGIELENMNRRQTIEEQIRFILPFYESIGAEVTFRPLD